MTDYGFKHEGQIFTPNATPVSAEDNNTRNKAIEAAELALWAAQPDSFAVYINKSADGSYRATTWLGTVLAHNVIRSRIDHNMSRKMMAVRFRGTNGANYYGRYGADWSELCRVRKAKG